MTDVDQRHSTAPRRGVLLGAGALGTAAIVTACGGHQSATAPTDTANTVEPATASPPTPLKARDVPVGGGAILQTQDTVVTQPHPGQFEAFSATCTHQGCTLSDVSGGTINCPCHGSQFSITDGSVVTGPANRPLPKKTVTLHNGTITIG